ncbi:MAG: DUF5672 family protein [Bernardetiaceae bacterium]
MIQAHQVAVVVPIYKQQPSENDLISLRQNTDILSGYDLVIVAPEGLDLSAYLDLYPNFKVHRFAPQFFDGIPGYNRLMLSAGFYAAFSAYAYILICQTDAYVFRDELLDWCNKGYDYIGAPFLVPMPITTNRPLIVNISRWLVDRVGNGGLSLRRVRTHLWATRYLGWLTRRFPKNEDIFWCYYPYRRPSCSEALHFAFDLAPRKAFALTQGKLPFGCHAWQRHDPEFWAQYIP